MGVLKEDDAQYAPQPGLALLDQLAEQSGMESMCAARGSERPLAPGVDVAAYRIVQEALTNARKHAAAERADVRVRFDADSVELEVGTRGGSSTG